MGIISEIKGDAVRNGTKIQNSEATKLEKILNKTFYLDKDIDGESKFVHQVMTRGAETQERAGLHASALIVGDKDFCLREQVLSLIYKQLQGEQINVGLMRIFEQGNAIHEKWQRLLIRAGYSTYKDLDVTQFNKKYRISFTPDVICKIPEFYDGQMIGEIKSVNTYQFKTMSRHPHAWKQLQFYMFLTGIHKGFVLSEDKNTQDFKIELYDYDKEIVAPFVDRAEEIKFRYNKVMKEHRMIKRPAFAKSPNSEKCSKCPMRESCWNIGNGKIPL
jgi:hypothetical protein